SSDIFGDVTDGNVGEFLKYLPGVDLDYVESEPRGPRLGGMDAQYVGVSFDGMRTASADANRGGGAASRATSFEGFSITSIDSIDERTAADRRPCVVRQIDFKDGTKWTRKDALLLTADWKATSRLTLSVNMVYSDVGGEFWNRNVTVVAANDNANVNNGPARV